MSVLIKGLNIKPCKDGFDGKGLVIIGYDDKLYAVAHEQIVPLPDDATIEPKKGKWKPFDLTWGRSVWACDACGETVDVPTLSGKPIFDYCPYCGARMERSEE